MFRSRSSKFVSFVFLFFLSLYAAASFLLGPGLPLALFATGLLCLAVLFANFGLLTNTATAYRRPKIFWTFLATSCTLWLAAQLIWTASAMSRRLPGNVSSPLADFLFYLSVVPVLAATGVRPHRRHFAGALRHGYIDLALLAAWFAWLFGYFVLPFRILSFHPLEYPLRNLLLVAAANAFLLATLLLVWRKARGDWRPVYFQYFCAAALHALGWLLVCRELAERRYYIGSFVDLPLLASFLWFGFTGLEASHRRPAPATEDVPSGDRHPATRLAFAGILSMPFLSAWAAVEPTAQAVRQFRVELSLAGVLIGVLLLLLRQHRVDRYRRSLLHATEHSLDRMNRLQAQLVLSEKLASLGDLTAGAAHAINNPLTAILGYADLLKTETSLSPRSRAAARKIREQAERTRRLVQNLFGFARRTPSEKALLDLNATLSSAVEMRRAQLAGSKVFLHLEMQRSLPAFRGDPKLLLQVFYEIMTNAADAMRPAGGHLRISTHRDGENLVVEFADTGPGVRRPDRVFDPFYTTKPVGQGTGLGLSLCYGIIQEHGGQLSCRNRPEGGGAVFRIELPAVILPLPLQHLLEPVAPST